MKVQVELSSDVRHAFACRAHGASRILLLIHGLEEDLLGAVDAAQAGVATVVAQDLIVHCALIRSAFTTGQLLSSDSQWDLGLDPFAGLSADERKTCLSLLARLAHIDRENVAVLAPAILDFAKQTEKRLGWPSALPVVRSPEGLFPALRLARLWGKTLARLKLPGLVPESWQGSVGTN